MIKMSQHEKIGQHDQNDQIGQHDQNDKMIKMLKMSQQKSK